jgi:hypothetical protein
MLESGCCSVDEPQRLSTRDPVADKQDPCTDTNVNLHI